MSIVSLAAIALERYFVMVKPSSPFANLSYAKKFIIIALIWIYCFLVTLPPLVGLSRYVPAGYLITCCFDFITRDWETRLFILVLFVFGLTVPMIFIIFSYFRIWQLSNAQSNAQSKSNSADQTPRKIKGKDLRLAKVIIFLVAIFLIAWTPYSVIALLGQFGPSYGGGLTPIMVMIPAIFAKSSTIYNPFIFGFRDSRFQRALRRYVFWCCCPPAPGDVSESATTAGPLLAGAGATTNAESVPMGGLAGTPEIPGMEINDEQDLEDDDDYLDAQLSYRLIEVERSPREQY